MQLTVAGVDGSIRAMPRQHASAFEETQVPKWDAHSRKHTNIHRNLNLMSYSELKQVDKQKADGLSNAKEANMVSKGGNVVSTVPIIEFEQQPLYYMNFAGTVKFGGLIFEGIYTRTEGKFVSVTLGVTASTEEMVNCLAESLGFGKPARLLALLSKPGEEDTQHQWKVELGTHTDKTKLGPAWAFFRDGESFSLIPWFLEWLQDKAIELCGKVLGAQCGISKFDASRMARTDLKTTNLVSGVVQPLDLLDLESDQNNRDQLTRLNEIPSHEDDEQQDESLMQEVKDGSLLKGLWSLQFNAFAEINPMPKGVDISFDVTYDYDSGDFQLKSATCKTVFKGIWGVTGLDVAPTDVVWSKMDGLSFTGTATWTVNGKPNQFGLNMIANNNMEVTIDSAISGKDMFQIVAPTMGFKKLAGSYSPKCFMLLP